ncbi:hypothetical protein BKA80DRAFT_256258 [Phyllosticta citrichinensis]
MEQFPYNSPPQTPVKRMINPEPFDTTPLQRLPELPQWLQEKSDTPARQGFNSDPRPHTTRWTTSRAFASRPQEGRVDPETSLRQALEFGNRSRSREIARSAAPPPSSQLFVETPTSEVVDEETVSPWSPVPSPRLRRKELTPIPTARLRDRALPNPAEPRMPDQHTPQAPPGRKTVHFRNTPVVYEVERTGWRPVPQRRRRHNNRRFRIVEVDRPPVFPESVKKAAFDLLPWAFCIAFVVVFVGIVAQLNGSTPIAQLDMRTRIPPDFYFTHREFRKLTPEEAPAYEYLSKAGKAGMGHLDQLIRLNKEAERQERVDGSKKKEWYSLSRRLDWVKIEWDDVLRNVRGEEKELITQATHWYDTKAAAQSTLRSPQMASLEAHERRKSREGWLEDIRGAASFSAKAIENQSRFVNSSLDTAKRVADMMLPSGCGLWENILLGPDFEEEKPGYLNRLPSLYTKFAPSWTSKWLERKRRRMQICSTLVPHLAYFQDYVRIVILSNEHLRAAARGVTELTGVDDSPASFDDIIPPPVIVTSDDLTLPTNSSASRDGGAAEPAKTPYPAEGDEGNQTSTTPIFPDHTRRVSAYRASVKRWGENLGRIFLGLPERSSQPAGDEDVRKKKSSTPDHVPSTEGCVNQGEETCPISNEPVKSHEYTAPGVTKPIHPACRTDEDGEPVSDELECRASGETVSTVTKNILSTVPVPRTGGVAAEAKAEDGPFSPHLPLPGSEPGSSLPCDLPSSTEGVAAPEAEESIPPTASSINEIPSRRNSRVVKAAREADEKRPNPATPAAPATIDDIFRAWDKILGGISLVIDREFRT